MPESEFERLEEALALAGRAIPYPVAPALAGRVSDRLAADRGRRGFGLPAPARIALAAAAALVLAIALLLAFPDAGEALARLLGLRTVRIILVTPTATVPPGPTPENTGTPSPSATATARPFALCCETTLAEAKRRARFTILLPPNETPSRVYFQQFDEFGNAQQVILLFGDPAAPTYSLYEAESMVYGKLLFVFGKEVSEGTLLAETSVNGHDARWIAGAPHLLVYLDPQGTPVPRSDRTVDANTLVWEIGDLTLRIETRLSQEEAIRFAESLR
jgi:hypothetical protein